MPRVDLQKIAKMAGVSRSTVSRVINDQPDVSPEVRKRVSQIVRETGYQPNAAARSLRNKRSDIIGLVLNNTVGGLFTDPYYPALTQGVYQACSRHNKTLALFLEGDPEAIYPRLKRRGHLDGILLQAGTDDDCLIKKMKQADVPFLVLGRPTEPNFSYIDVDNTSGSYQATLHLIRQKRQRIAAIFAPLMTTTGVDRKEGYCRALRERSMPYREELTAEGDFSEERAYQLMKGLLQHHPDAIFCASDAMARGAVHAILDSGLSIPDDVAVVGFDDLPPAVSAAPLLTTVRQPITNMGTTAVEILLDMIEHPQPPYQRVVMDVELVVREFERIKGHTSGNFRTVSTGLPVTGHHRQHSKAGTMAWIVSEGSTFGFVVLRNSRGSAITINNVVSTSRK